MFEGAYETASTFFNTHPTEIALSAVSIAAIGALIWGIREVILAKDKKYMHEYVPRIRTKTLVQARYAYADDYFANMIKYAAEKAVFDKALTREEVNIRYRRLNKGFRNKNFIPSFFRLKADLKAKRAAAKLHPPKEVKPASNVVVAAFGSKSRRRSTKSA